MSTIKRQSLFPCTLASLMLWTVLQASATVFTWDGNGGDGSWSDANNWGGTGPVDGDELYFGSGFASGTTLNNDALSTVNSLIFLPPAGGLTLQGNDLTLTGGLTNQNAAAGRNVTIENNLNISGAQIWRGSANANGITIINGDLSGNGNITLSNWNQSDQATLPALRLGGSNSGYTGTITTDGANSFGVLLLSPTAMTGGLIDLNSGNRNLWLTANSSGNPYVFGTGNTAGSANVNFRNAGTSGLYLTGGDVYWDPGNGGDYTWAAGTHGQIRINGSNDSARRMLYWGNDSSNLILDGNRGIYNGGGGNNPGYITIRSALADDATGGRVLTFSTTLAILTRDAVNNGAAKSSVTVAGGALAVSGMNQIFDGNLNLSGGVLVLDGAGVVAPSWNDFIADRNSGYGNGANQWRVTGGGFAARGSGLTIANDVNGTNWFNTNFVLGNAARDADGAFYANASVTLSQDTVMTDRRTVSIGVTGPGLKGASGVVNYISGNLSDTWNGATGNRGALTFGASGASSDTASGEVVLSGANSLHGSLYVNDNNNYRFNTGPGGILINQDVIVRFNGDASLPTGNDGNLSWLAATRRNTAGGRYGFMLTGDADGETYALSPGQKFLLGGELPTIFGSTGGAATIEDSSIVAAPKLGVNAISLNLLVRDGTLTLGSTGQSLSMEIGQIGNAVADGGLGGVATPVTDVATGQVTLVKYGPGTLSLGDVVYRQATGGADAQTNFFWQIGRGGADNTPASAYFDGAIRETGNTTANSLTGFNVRFQGGVLESSDAVIGGSFTRALGTGTTQVRWQQGGGGFAAYGGALTVNIGNNAGSTSLVWGATSFVTANNPLIFGSRTADSQVTWLNPISLNAGTRDIRVIDNAGSASDLAELAGGLTGTAAANNLLKTGDGILRMAGPSVYGGATTVSAGTLLIGADDNAPAPLTIESVQTTGETITITNHGFTVGQRIGLDAGTMIGGTSRDIIYYVVNTTPDTFQISLSDGGSAVDLTSGGSGRSVLQAGALGARTATAVTLGDASTGNTPVALLTDGAYTVARPVIVANVGGTVTLGGNTDANSVFSGGVALNKNVRLTSVATGGNRTTFSGVISNGTTTGNAVIKVGAGVVELSGANTYDGGTIVNTGTLIANNDSALGTGAAQVDGGTLQVAGGVTIGNAVTVNNGGTLAGAGTVGGAVGINAGGALAPGTSPGTLTVNSLTLDSFTYLWELGDTVMDHDSVAVLGNLTFTPAAPITLSLASVGSYIPQASDVFVLFAVSGTTGDFNAGNWTFDYGTTGWTGGTVSQDGENVVLSGLTPVPEPATLALLGLGGALAAWRRRKPA